MALGSNSDTDRTNRRGCLIIVGLLLLAIGLIVVLGLSADPKGGLDQLAGPPAE